MKFYRELILTSLSFVLVLVWGKSDLSKFSVPLIGLLIFAFLLVSMKTKKNLNLGGPINFFLLNCVLLLFIVTTGGLSSNLFFILYFLLFGAAFIMDPRVVFVIPIGIVILFFPDVLRGDTVSNIIKIVSLGLLSPLAFFFGQQFKTSEKDSDEVLKTKERESAAAQSITEDVKDILSEDKSELNDHEVEKLNEILVETEDLRSEKR